MILIKLRTDNLREVTHEKQRDPMAVHSGGDRAWTRKWSEEKYPDSEILRKVN